MPDASTVIVDAALCDAIPAMCWQTLAPVLLDTLASPFHASVLVLGVARVGDPGATRTVYATVVLLALLGVMLAMLAAWVFRRTRPEPELLAPLETMQTRRWRNLDPAAQRRSLDESRPTGAVPIRREASAPAVDSSFATVAPVSSFDDLSDTAGDDDDPAAIDGVIEGNIGDTQDQPRADAQMFEGDVASAEPEIADDTGEIAGNGEFDIDIGIGLDDEYAGDDNDADASADGDGEDVDEARAVRHIDPLLLPKQPLI